MKTRSNPDQFGCTAKIFVTLGCLTFGIGFIASAWNTQNPLFMLGAIGSVFLGLLQIESIHHWFINHASPLVDQHASKVMKDIQRGAVKAWGLRNIVLVFTIFGLVIAEFTPVLSIVQNQISESLCIQQQLLPTCGNGVYVTPMEVNESKNNTPIRSNVNVGIIDNGNKDKGPFNQYDANNNGIEQNLENKIFTQNQECRGRTYVTLIVATALSQTVADTGLSSSVGLDNLRGAYMAQYNFNQDKSHCLHLLIANFGTKGVAWHTVPILMQQIKLYANSDPQHFMGVVGLTFSVSVMPALYSRAKISGDDIPIISSSAAANSFATPNDTTPLPANFYTNFYRVVPPASVEGKVITAFTEDYLAQTQTQTVLFEDPNEVYTRSLSNAIYQNFSGNIKEIDYTVGQPNTLKDGIDYVIAHQCNQSQQQQCNPIQIFFAGFADDLNTLKNKLNTERENGGITQSNIQIIGGQALYDLGSYNIGNYGNLFFTISASYSWINPGSHSDGIPFPLQFQHCSEKPPYSEAFNCEFRAFFHQVYPTSIYGSELAGTHVLLIYDAVQSFLNALSHSREETTIPIWEAINKHWSDVKFQGVSGKIQFSQSSTNSINDLDDPNNPANKPIYVACTDSHSYTHVVARYDINGDQLQSDIRKSELDACLTGS